MSLYWRSTSLAVSFIFLLAFGQVSCMPTRNQLLDYAKKPLTSDEAVKIQNLLKAALEELTDDHVLLVLKRSLLLYFKVCLYPYPAPNLVKLPGREGAMEDENSSPTQTNKDTLREILLESIDSVNPKNTLDFLKSSVQFRLRYCFSPAYKINGPISSPEEPPTLQSTQKTSTKLILNVQTSRNYAQETATNKVGNDAPEPEVSHQSETTQTDEIENILSIITELNAKSESSVDEIPSAQNINTANDSPGKPFKPVAAQEVSEAKNQEIKSQEKESAPEVPKPKTRFLASSTENKPSQVDIALKNSTASFAENPHGEKKLNGLPPTKAKINLEKTDPNEKLSETLVDKPKTVAVQAEPEHSEEYSVVETSERVGKAELQGNSNEGEFSSVTRINYNEVTIEDQRPEVVGVDAGFDV
ncbi:uncharacterized protein LOC114953910 [Acropora millepora]|uniref:uncharacterized protein LOC114953910 n=1 Tax=Acropora millepora TaxID=45264 RepID=UPI001CF4D0AA|nr:uncharacterized protein LOC114953910 [Acropora millepora]